MAGIHLQAFLGEMPIRDIRRLPNELATVAEDVRVDGGSMKPLYEATAITSLAATTKRVFRIPTGDLDTFSQSHWMQFDDEFTTVVRTPVTNDSHERYYWCSPTEGMRYNTKTRILAGDPSYKLGVVPPANAPTVTPDETTGERKKRTLGDGDFDADQYLADNPDVANYIALARTRFATEHYINYGRAEGRTRFFVPGTEEYEDIDGTSTYVMGSGEFDHEAYYNEYSDVLDGFHAQETSDALDHYIRFGEAEGRDFPVKAGTEEDLGFANPVVTRSYVYTYVTIYGEESQPSPPAEGVGAIDQVWNITIQQPPTIADRAPIDKIRIYRTVTGASGSTVFFRVDEIAVGGANVIADNKTDTVVSGASQLDSTLWAPPVDGMEGMIAMPNGIIAAWKGNTIWFCENFRPHAWPVEYELTVQYPIVGCGVFGNSLVVCTQSHPAIISGVRSVQMAMQDNLGAVPCTSRLSIVSTNMGVIYASEGGLVMVGPSGMQQITDPVIGRFTWWSKYKPYTIKASLVQGAYIATFTDGGVTRAFILDPNNAQAGLVHLTGISFEAGIQTDPWSGKALTIEGSTLMELLPPNGTPRYGRWVSKELQMPEPVNLAAGEIFYDPYDGDPLGAGEEVGEIIIYADNREIYNQPFPQRRRQFRLPSGFKAEVWQIEIRSRVRVHSIHLASSAAALKNV